MLIAVDVWDFNKLLMTRDFLTTDEKLWHWHWSRLLPTLDHYILLRPVWTSLTLIIEFHSVSEVISIKLYRILGLWMVLTHYTTITTDQYQISPSWGWSDPMMMVKIWRQGQVSHSSMVSVVSGQCQLCQYREVMMPATARHFFTFLFTKWNDKLPVTVIKWEHICHSIS